MLPSVPSHCMDPINDARFYESLIKPPSTRSPEDVRNIYEQLRQLDMFATLYNAPLKAICASARYERHPPHHLLFKEGHIATCWYILLSGSVFIDRSIYLPYGCFGKRNGINYRRTTDCVVLTESEMIVIDYPDVQRISAGARVTALKSSPAPHPPVHSQSLGGSGSSSSSSSRPPPPHHHHHDPLIPRAHHARQPHQEAWSSRLPPPVPPRPPRHPAPPPPPPARPPRGLQRHYDDGHSVSSYECGPSTSSGIRVTTIASLPADNHRNHVVVNDATSTSSSHANSEDDNTATLVKVKHRRDKAHSIGGVQNLGRVRSATSTSSTDETPGSLSGPLDSDEDDDESVPSNDNFLELKDSVRECLEKEPKMRNSDDISILLDFMQHMAAFASLPLSIKRQLCLKMVFAVVNDRGTMVMQHGERLDAWSVIVNGHVEVVKPNGERLEYKLGDAFGCQPSSSPQYQDGDMRTLVDDCEFVLVEHKDFCSIMSTMGEDIERDRDGLTGEVVSETERRTVGNQVGLVLIKGKPDKLVSHLVEERDSSMDPHYVDDFLLTFRVFIPNPCGVLEKLMYWFADPHYRDRVARIVLLWVNNHYNDFETSDEMTKLLTRFESALERDGMHSQQSLLNIACSVKAKPREVTLRRSGKDEPLPFEMIGGKDHGTGIFVCKVDADSAAESVGLRKGDEVLEMNGLPLKYATAARAKEMAMGSLHVRMLVKSNFLDFKDCLMRMSTDSPLNARTRTKMIASQIDQPRSSVPNMKVHGGGGGDATAKAVVAKSSGAGMMDKLLMMLRPARGETMEDATHHGSEMRTSRSNPDLAAAAAHSQQHGLRFDAPEHVLKIYRADQTFKYLAVYKETSAQNVVQLALQEFGMTAEGSLEWSLCETTVTPERVIKQRRLPPQLENLAERIALNSRYYLKNNSRSDPLVPDEMAPEILKEAQCNLLDLNAHVVACQLTLQDFAVFASIEPTEYVDNLFQLDSRYGWARLSEFERLFNREMWWVGSEVCTERNVGRRAKLIKKFIKIARYCRDLRNFNSMFAIMSGLDKPAVRRLHASWDRVGSKYLRWLEEVRVLVDPSRNMSRYRQHLASVAHDPPILPIYPLLKKDLTFMHEGNPTYSDKLVNFEKLRLIARAVRGVGKLSSAPYEIGAMAHRSGASMNDALLHMNTFEYAGTVATMRKGGRAGSLSRKKVYEQALMVRKVKAYLAELRVVESESELDELSTVAEPLSAAPDRASASTASSAANVNSGASNATTAPATTRRPISTRAPSPTPSSLSSHSTGSGRTGSVITATRFVGSRFGVESPQAVQKMLALVQQSKTKEKTALIPPVQGSATMPRPLPRGDHTVTIRTELTNDTDVATGLSAESSSVTAHFKTDVLI